LWGNASYSYDAMGNMKVSSIGEAPVDPDPDILSADPLARPLARRTTFEYSGTTSKLDNVAEWGRDVPSIETTPLRVATSTFLRGRSVQYAAAGNKTSYFGTRLYSARNQMAAITNLNDEGGVRVHRTETPATETGDSATRYFYYTSELQLLTVSEETGPNLWSMSLSTRPMRYEIIWFGGLPIAQTTSSVTILARRGYCNS
jgi:hypothetical protein